MTWVSQRGKQEYKLSREAPDLSVGERRHWESLVANISERHKEDGFDEKYFTQLFSAPGGADKQENWEKLRHDWQEAIFNQLCRKESEWIRRQGEHVPMQLETAYKQMARITQKLGAQ